MRKIGRSAWGSSGEIGALDRDSGGSGVCVVADRQIPGVEGDHKTDFSNRVANSSQLANSLLLERQLVRLSDR